MIIIHVIIIIIYVGCSFGQPTKKCSSDICDSSVCTNYPNAVCYPDECADCSPRYFIGNDEVTNVCGKFLLLYKKFVAIKIDYTPLYHVYALFYSASRYGSGSGLGYGLFSYFISSTF